MFETRYWRIRAFETRYRLPVRDDGSVCVRAGLVVDRGWCAGKLAATADSGAAHREPGGRPQCKHHRSPQRADRSSRGREPGSCTATRAARRASAARRAILARDCRRVIAPPAAGGPTRIGGVLPGQPTPARGRLDADPVRHGARPRARPRRPATRRGAGRAHRCRRAAGAGASPSCPGRRAAARRGRPVRVAAIFEVPVALLHRDGLRARDSHRRAPDDARLERPRPRRTPAGRRSSRPAPLMREAPPRRREAADGHRPRRPGRRPHRAAGRSTPVPPEHARHARAGAHGRPQPLASRMAER